MNPEYIGASVDVGGYLVGDPSFREEDILLEKMYGSEAWPSDGTNCKFSQCCQCGAAIRKSAGRIFEEYIMPLTKEVQNPHESIRKMPSAYYQVTMSQDVTAS